MTVHLNGMPLTTELSAQAVLSLQVAQWQNAKDFIIKTVVRHGPHGGACYLRR